MPDQPPPSPTPTIDGAPGAGIAELPTIDPTSEAFLDDQPGALAAAQAESWVARSPFGLHLLTTDASAALLRDPRFHPGVAMLCESGGITEGRFHEDFTSSMLAVGGAAHRKLRRPINPFFQNRAVEQSRDWLRTFIGQEIDALRDRSVIEIQREVSTAIPAALFCNMVGVGPSEIPFVARVSDSILKVFLRDLSVRDEINAAYDELVLWCEDLLAVRRREPGDDLVSFIAQQDELSAREAINLLTVVLEASTDNTSNQLSIAVQLLAEHPDEWAHLRADRAWIGPVVDEVLRVRPRVTTGNRTTDEDVELLGMEIPAGSWVFSSVIAAHRDPAVYDRPHEFLPGRSEPPTHLLFGLGPHYCIGAALARLELEVAIDVMASRWSTIELADTPVRLRNWALDGLIELPVAPTWA
jgi:cytochrome P450